MTEGDTKHVTEEPERKFEGHNFKGKIRRKAESMKNRFEEAEGSSSPDTALAISVVFGLIGVSTLSEKVSDPESLAATGMYQTIIDVAVMCLILWAILQVVSSWRRRLMREVGSKIQPEDGERTSDHEKDMLSFLRSCSKQYLFVTLAERVCYVTLLFGIVVICFYITTSPCRYIVAMILSFVILWLIVIGRYDAFHMYKTDLNGYKALETEMGQVNIPHPPVPLSGYKALENERGKVNIPHPPVTNHVVVDVTSFPSKLHVEMSTKMCGRKK